MTDLTKTEKIIRAGERMWRASHSKPPEMRDVIEILLKEATETLRAVRADRPKGFGSAWPEFVLTAGEIKEIYNQRLAEIREAQRRGDQVDWDLYQIGEKKGQPPSAEAVSRLLEVMDWLKHIPVRNKRHKALRQRMTLVLSAGVSPTSIANWEEFAPLGYTNRHAVAAAHYRAVGAIETKLREILPEGFRLDVPLERIPHDLRFA